MYNGFKNLIPFVSTYFRREEHDRLHKVEEWQKDEKGVVSCRFLDEEGYQQVWYRDSGARDASFETNLQKILEE